VPAGTDLSHFIQKEHSQAGRGGMVSKYATATHMAQQGIRVIIANGTRPGILQALLEDRGNVPHTEFIPKHQTSSN